MYDIIVVFKRTGKDVQDLYYVPDDTLTTIRRPSLLLLIRIISVPCFIVLESFHKMIESRQTSQLLLAVLHELRKPLRMTYHYCVDK